MIPLVPPKMISEEVRFEHNWVCLLFPSLSSLPFPPLYFTSHPFPSLTFTSLSTPSFPSPFSFSPFPSVLYPSLLLPFSPLFFPSHPFFPSPSLPIPFLLSSPPLSFPSCCFVMMAAVVGACLLNCDAHNLGGAVGRATQLDTACSVVAQKLSTIELFGTCLSNVVGVRDPILGLTQRQQIFSANKSHTRPTSFFYSFTSLLVHHICARTT